MDHLAVRSAEKFDALDRRNPSRPLLLEILPDEQQTSSFLEALSSR
jgi:hypothetical protein